MITRTYVVTDHIFHLLVVGPKCYAKTDHSEQVAQICFLRLLIRCSTIRTAKAENTDQLHRCSFALNNQIFFFYVFEIPMNL